jgi:excisionase family DNA binding protein
MTLDPRHLTDDGWARLRAFFETAREKGEVVDLSARVEMLSPAEVGRRLGMSRTTVRRRIAAGELAVTKVGTHNRITLPEFERFRRELMFRMAQASADEIAADLFDE